MRDIRRKEKETEIVSWIQPNIKKAYKTKTAAEILNSEEIDVLITTAKNARDKAIIVVLYDTATRVSEFANILMGEIHQTF
jgi:site-specific recombinase XerD